MNTAILPQTDTPVKRRIHSTDSEYTQFLQKLRATLADGQWHNLRTSEMCRAYHVSHYTFPYMKDRGVLEQSKSIPGHWRRRPALNELDGPKLHRLVNAYAKEQINKKNTPSAEVKEKAVETKSVLDIPALRGQGLGMGEVAKMARPHGLLKVDEQFQFDNKLPDWNFPQQDETEYVVEVNVPMSISSSDVTFDDCTAVSEQTNWFLPQQETDDTQECSTGSPSAGCQDIELNYAEGDKVLSVRVQISGYMDFDIDCVEQFLDFSVKRIQNLIQAELYNAA